LGVALAAIILTPAMRSTAATFTPLPEPFSAGDRREIISPHWTNLCQKGGAANAQQICFIVVTKRIRSGIIVVALIEPARDPKKILRITLPLGLDLRLGMKIVIDQGDPMNAPYITCVNSGCIADFEANAELIDRLKQGRGLEVQGTNSQGQVLSVVMPLSDLGKAYDGPPTDPH
jgi:invasion protein IalB